MNRRICILAVAALLLAACSSGPEPLSAEDIARNNQAVGLMGQYRNEEARAIFAELAARYPDWPQLRSNEAIATLNRQTEGDEERALAIANEMLAEHPGHLPAQYVAGLAHLYLGRVEDAAPHLMSVAKADPQDAHAAYFAGQALGQLDRADEALALYQRAIAADPYLGSAYYAAALVMRDRGDAETARALLADYRRLQSNPRAKLAEFRYTRMGEKAMAQVLGESPPHVSAAPAGDVFSVAAPLQALPSRHSLALLTADLDVDGRQDLIQLTHGGARMWRADGSGYVTMALPAGFPADAGAAAAGDIDNDGRLDLALCGPAGISLWRLGEDAMLTAREDTLPEAARKPCHDVQLFDADHDGDLDLYRVGGSQQRGELLNNNLDGSWRALSEESPLLAGPETGALQLLVLDVDADRDLDLVFLGADGHLQWLRNDRLWAYRSEPLPSAWQIRWRAVTAIDLEASGRPDLVLIDAEGSAWTGRLEDGGLVRMATGADLPALFDVSAFDADGDGLEDLLFRHTGGVSLMARDTEGVWQLRWRHEGEIESVLAIVEDAARGPSLLLVESGAEQDRLLRAAPGPGRQAFVTLAPSGRSAGSEGMRSNASGIGTQLRLRSGTRWTVADLLDRDSGAGQSLQPLAMGVGDAVVVDFLELQWSDGVMQTELALASGTLHRIEETQRQLASCPVLFAWDGERFRFVSDLLGVGGIGFLLAPGQYAESRPWEYFRLPDGIAVEKDGAFHLKIAEPMEEAAYIDAVRLHVYDLPPGWSLAMDERMHTGGGPAPSGAPLFYRTDDSPRLAYMRGEQGSDLSSVLAAADFDAVDPGPRDPRFLGRLLDEQQIELGLTDALRPDEDYALVGDGWVEYPYSQTLFAAWQARADYRSYSLDLRDASGRWGEAYAQFGYPAGMPREFALPLPPRASPVDALRLRGNLEVYLDRLRLVRLQPAPKGLRHQVVSPAFARMERIGFPRRHSHAGKRPDYDFSSRTAFWDTRYPEGSYTDFGPVEPLLEAIDDGFAIVGPGDALDLAFEAPVNPPDGYRRVLVLEVRGYAKDMDLYTRDGGTLGPLPETPGIDPAMRARGDALNRQFNQRFQAGR